MKFIEWYDYILLPFYLAAVMVFAYKFRTKHYPAGHPWRPYFIPAISVKLFGAVAIGLIYQYYYGSGDTGNFFNHARIINSSFFDSPEKWFKLILRIPDWYQSEYYQYTSRLIWYESPSNYFVGALAAFIGIVCYTSYLPTAVLFAALSFTGMWAMFRTFATLYPSFTKPIAIAILFIPSTFLWGSGIFKDTVCMFALGWLTYAFFKLVFQRKFSLPILSITLLCGYILAVVKIYILISYVPAMTIWLLSTYSYKFKNELTRMGIFASSAILFALLFILLSSRLSDTLGMYSTDSILKTSEVTRDYILAISGDDGSGYDLGEIDGSMTGLLLKAPQAINVSLFRPYVWEARKPIIFLNALEAFAFLLMTLKVIVEVGLANIIRHIRRDPTIQFCIIFSLIFAFAVGISSYNFGALSRYRIPCLPLYAMFLLLIYYKHKQERRQESV